MRILTWLISTMVAVAVAAWLLPGIGFDGVSAPFAEEMRDKFVPALIVAGIMGAVNITIAPIIKFFSFPFIVLTLGVLLLVINALLLRLVAWLAEQLGAGFFVDGFWWAMLGSVVITATSSLMNAVFDG